MLENFQITPTHHRIGGLTEMPSISGIVRVFEAYGFYQLNKNALHQDYKGQVMSKGTGMGWFGGIVREGLFIWDPSSYIS